MARSCSRRSSALGRPREVAISALGVREGLLFDRLDPRRAAARPAASRPPRDLNLLRSRSPRARRGAVRTGPTASSTPSACRRPRTSAAAATPPAFSPISAGGRIPTIAASRASTSSPTRPSSASTIRAAPISRLSIFFRHEGFAREGEPAPEGARRRRACSSARACSAR